MYAWLLFIIITFELIYKCVIFTINLGYTPCCLQICNSQDKHWSSHFLFPFGSSGLNKDILVWESTLHKQVHRVYHVRTILANHNNHEST